MSKKKSVTAVTRLGWKPINRKKLPKTGFVLAGSYRDGRWTTSSVSDGDGFPRWADDDRTHYFQIRKPPSGKLTPLPGEETVDRKRK